LLARGSSHLFDSFAIHHSSDHIVHSIFSINTAYWKGWDNPDVGADMLWDADTTKGRSLVDFDVFPHFDRSLHAVLLAEKSVGYEHKVISIPDNMAVVHSLKDGVIRNFEYYADGSLANVSIRTKSN